MDRSRGGLFLSQAPKGTGAIQGFLKRQGQSGQDPLVTQKLYKLRGLFGVGYFQAEVLCFFPDAGACDKGQDNRDQTSEITQQKPCPKIHDMPPSSWSMALCVAEVQKALYRLCLSDKAPVRLIRGHTTAARFSIGLYRYFNAQKI